MSTIHRATCALLLLWAGACTGSNEPEPGDASTATLTASEQSTASVSTSSASSASSAASASPASGILGDFVPGELIVELDQKLEPQRALELGGVRLVPLRQLRYGAWHVLLSDGAAAHAAVTAGRTLDATTLAAAEQLTLDARAALARTPGVISAVVNLNLEFSAVPSDPFYASYQRWNYEAVRLPEAWDYTVGSSGVRMAIIDSESDQNAHPDLVGKWSGGRSFSTAPQTYHHGAHVAGIAGGAADGNLGVGVCWNCRMAPYRIAGSVLAIGDAIDWAAGDGSNPPRAEVVNISLNKRLRDSNGARLLCTDPESAPVKTALARAISRGVIVVVSAGNFEDPVAAFPANCPDTISVAAIQPGGTLALYSNRGSAVTLAAPGGGGSGNSQFGSWLAEMPCPPPHVFSNGVTDPFDGTVGVASSYANYTDPIAPNGYCYRYLSGTSMAAPHVTGTVGLMKSRNLSLSPAQARDILVRTAQTNTPCPPVTCGAGLLNAAAATRYAPEGGVPTATLSGASFGAVNVGAQVTSSALVTSNGSTTVSAGGGAPMQILGGGGQIEFAYSTGCTSGTTCSSGIFIVQGTSQSIPLRCRPTAAGAITATLRLPSNRFDPSIGAVDAPLSVALTCTGIAATPDVTVAPTSLSFGAVDLGTTSSAQLVTVRNDGGGTLAVSASESSPDFSLTCQSGCTCAGASCTASLGAAQSAVLAVAFSPQALGARAATLTIATPGDPDEPSTAVSLAGTGVQAGLEIRPQALHAGAVRVGSSGLAYGTLYNPGTGTLRVTQLSLNGSAGIFSFACDGDTCVPPFDLPAGTGRAIAIRCTPARNAPYITQLAITSNAPGSPTTGGVQCQGLAPEIAVTPSDGVAFGTVGIGATATAHVGIYNTTANLGTTLTWSASVSSGQVQLTCLSTTNCTCGSRGCSGTSAGGASLQLTFAPTTTKGMSATLTVTSNDPDHPLVTRPITGTGAVVSDPPGPPADPM